MTAENTPDEISFEAAIAEVDALVKKIQNQRSLDSLVADVKRAKELITMCESRILATESELEDILGVDGVHASDSQ
ncbi:exodeoxyribonuclease VII small subunit [Acidithrix sp. C25]|uniref:exodeoxyribonuclease VII small subunit n=1 Tax=Acidithrix sp. C25 TaxID=1671482 RepID=UPI00191BB80E|nr:exodeoxyribonuclease VII small subunit [Acidithrix sp. C25]CAG4931429.1 unnamed protein product [Acidithrix sp. C25]